MAEKHLVVIGSGPGGYVAAIRAAMKGVRTTVIEKGDLGGTCLNVGCIPTKALAATAHLLERARRASTLGVRIENAEVDFPAAMKHKQVVVGRLTKGIESLFKKRKIELVRGHARFVSPNAVDVDDGERKTRIEATNFIIATGSVPAKPGFFPFDGERVVTSEEMLSIPEIPGRLLIVGGGVIGCEFASIFSTFGSEVTIVEMLPSILSTLDADLVKELSRSFKKSKVKTHSGVKVEKLEVDGGTVRAVLSEGGEVEADAAMVAIGRRANTEGLGLDVAGIATNEQGFIIARQDGKTDVSHVYAIGDVTGHWQLAHAASAQGIAAADTIAGEDPAFDGNVVPYCVFTTPELGTVGLSEEEAAAEGVEVKVGKFALRTLGKAQALDELTGFVKLVGDASTGKLLGMHVAGYGASIIVHEGAIALKAGATVKDVAHTIHAHPTMSEAVMEAAEDFLGGAIHG